MSRGFEQLSYRYQFPYLLDHRQPSLAATGRAWSGPSASVELSRPLSKVRYQGQITPPDADNESPQTANVVSVRLLHHVQASRSLNAVHLLF